MTFKLGLLMLLSLTVGCGSDEKESDDGEVSPGAGRELYRALAADGNYVPLSFAELVDDSEVIAVGRMVDVKRGMTFVHETQTDPARFSTVVVQFEPSSSLKGASSHVFLEFSVGPPPDIEALRADLPANELAVFAVSVTRSPSEGTTYENEGAGYPEGSSLSRLTTPQGLVAEDGGDLVQPLERGDRILHENGSTLADLAASVEGEL